jgi:hypothetical protein
MGTDWPRRVDGWRKITTLKTFAPASPQLIHSAHAALKRLPPELEGLYRVTNGLSANAFKILPIEDPADTKRTWDGICRANDPRATRFLARSSELLDRFIVFADIGVGRAAAIDRTEGSIWYEEEGQLKQTDLSLCDFVEASLREIADE